MANFSPESDGQLQLVPVQNTASSQSQLWPELMPDGIVAVPPPADPAEQILDAAALEYLENIAGTDVMGTLLEDPNAAQTQLALMPTPGLADIKVAGPLGNTEPKSLLNTYCQKVTKRPVTKGDVAYTTQHAGGGYYQGTVTLHCLGGIQFAGEVSASRKDAEKKAAEQALAHYSIASPASNQVARAGIESSMSIAITPTSVGPPAPLPQELAEMSSKAALNTVLGRAVKVGLSSGSVQYDCSIVPGGFQALIRVPCLPGIWSQKAWSGEVCPKKKDAENSAAHYAVSDILTDPTFFSAYSAPRPNAAIRMGGYKGIQDQRSKLTSSASLSQSLDIVFEGRSRGQADISPATTLASVRALIKQKRMRGIPDDFMFEVNGASLPRDQEILCLARDLLPEVNIVSADIKGARVRLRPAPNAPY